MKRNTMPVVLKIPRQQTKVPSDIVQVFAGILALIGDLYPSDQEFVWRRVGEWKQFKVQS